MAPCWAFVRQAARSVLVLACIPLRFVLRHVLMDGACLEGSLATEGIRMAAGIRQVRRTGKKLAGWTTLLLGLSLRIRLRKNFSCYLRLKIGPLQVEASLESGFS